MKFLPVGCTSKTSIKNKFFRQHEFDASCVCRPFFTLHGNFCQSPNIRGFQRYVVDRGLLSSLSLYNQNSSKNLRMKAISTLIIVLLFGAMALAQNTENNVDVETFKMDFVLDSGISTIEPRVKIAKSEQNQVARIYKFKK